ncbi:hypothetical protein BCY82_24960 [Klebsiella quasipneumoniae]|nr:hypothetical protein BCY82_24960 [Klebsiella quasipneumoniae]
MSPCINTFLHFFPSIYKYFSDTTLKTKGQEIRYRLRGQRSFIIIVRVIYRYFFKCWFQPNQLNSEPFDIRNFIQQIQCIFNFQPFACIFFWGCQAF